MTRKQIHYEYNDLYNKCLVHSYLAPDIFYEIIQRAAQAENSFRTKTTRG